MRVFTVNPTKGIDNLMETALKDLKQTGEIVINQRTDSKILEIMGYSITSSNPIDRIIRNPKRRNNLVAQIAETLWVISGSREIKYISPFLPRAIDFSDDGETWRAGYGRISCVNLSVGDGFMVTRTDENGDDLFFPEIEDSIMFVDQLSNVVDILRKDPSSRQAYIVIPIAGDNLVLNETLDTPCTLSIQFLLRDGELNCFTNMRSNDAIWGLTGINYFEWTFIQELIANLLGVKVGQYIHTVGSFHIYERHFKNMDEIIKAEYSERNTFNDQLHTPVKVNGLDELNELIYRYLEIFDLLQEPDTEQGLAVKLLEEVFSFKSPLKFYMVIPLMQLAFLNKSVEANFLWEMWVEHQEKPLSNGNLEMGLLKSRKFFLGDYLSTIVSK